MRAFRECVFDDTIIGETTVYTATQFNGLLASVPALAIQANSFNVAASDDFGELSVQIQVSADGRNWLDKYAAAEIDQVNTAKNAVNVDIGYDDGTEPSMPLARLKITTAGNTERTGLKLWVTRRAVVPGSVRRAAAARRVAARQAAVEAPGQRQATQAPKSTGGCGGECGCGGKCGAKGGADELAGSQSNVRFASAARAQERLVTAQVDREFAARGADLFSAATPLFDLASGSADDLGGAILRIRDDKCAATAGACVSWCDEVFGDDAADAGCYACCRYHHRKCRNDKYVTPKEKKSKGVCSGFPGLPGPAVPQAQEPGSGGLGPPAPPSGGDDECDWWDRFWWSRKDPTEKHLICEGKSAKACTPTCKQFAEGSMERTRCMECCWCHQVRCRQGCGKFPEIFAETGCKWPEGAPCE